MLRLKMVVQSVKSVAGNDGSKQSEEIALAAVTGSKEDTVNAQWSKWTPSAGLNAYISNPDAFGKLLPGQFVFVDIRPCEKDSA